jgi:cytoskeleton protein RodZ
MATPGQRLQEARERANLTLQDVADRTKIPRWILANIEDDDLSHVPSGVFIRGYLRSFACAVGLDAESVWADYRATCMPPVETAPVVPDIKPREGVSRWMFVGIAAAVLVVAVVWRNASRSNPDTLNLPAQEPHEHARDVLPAVAPVSRPAPEAVAAVNSTAAGRLASAPASAPAPATLIVALHALSEVWLEAKVDGEQRMYRLVTAGEDIKLDAQHQVVLRIGDAAAVTYTINGLPGRALGAAGAVRDLTITPDTYKTYIDASR